MDIVPNEQSLVPAPPKVLEVEIVKPAPIDTSKLPKSADEKRPVRKILLRWIEDGTSITEIQTKRPRNLDEWTAWLLVRCVAKMTTKQKMGTQQALKAIMALKQVLDGAEPRVEGETVVERESKVILMGGERQEIKREETAAVKQRTVLLGRQDK